MLALKEGSLMARRYLPWIVLLSMVLHLVGIARTVVPAQDGLKFIRVAREFGQRPWADVVRGSDQHPLYPICIALIEPAIALVLGPGPGSWQASAQLVSALASLLLLGPLFVLTRRLYDEPTALLACLLFAVLPATCEIGHDTLSDSLALALFTTGLMFGERMLRTRTPAAAVSCGVASGLGYWARPELAVLPVVVVGVAVVANAYETVRRSTLGWGRPSISMPWTVGRVHPTGVGWRDSPIFNLVGCAALTHPTWKGPPCRPWG